MLQALNELILELPKMLQRVRRWTHFSQMPHDERETVETHTLQQTWLAGAMLAIERTHGTLGLDDARILLATSVHDIGEGHIGDIRYQIKQDPRVREALLQIEHEFAGKQFECLPKEVRERFAHAYALETEDSIDGRFFNAVERLGYMYIAVPQVKLGRTQFLEVFERQHAKILELSQIFVSLRVLYDPYRSYVEEQLQLLERDRELRRSRENADRE